MAKNKEIELLYENQRGKVEIIDSGADWHIMPSKPYHDWCFIICVVIIFSIIAFLLFMLVFNCCHTDNSEYCNKTEMVQQVPNTPKEHIIELNSKYYKEITLEKKN